MCTDTFLRLPEEKRTRFLSAAWEEFSRAKFADVSINRIVHGARIPRGSFYQYFTGKEDLFDYLLAEVQTQFIKTFSCLLEQTGGDIFRLQLMIYDQLSGRQSSPPSSLLDHCLRILQVNPGLDLKRLIAGRMEQEFPPELMEKIDVSRFRRQDPIFVRRVFLLCIIVLGGALMDTLLQPERGGEHREELKLQLELIQYGSLRPRPGPSETI